MNSRLRKVIEREKQSEQIGTASERWKKSFFLINVVTAFNEAAATRRRHRVKRRWEKLVDKLLEESPVHSNAMMKWKRASTKIRALHLFQQGRKMQHTLKRCTVCELVANGDIDVTFSGDPIADDSDDSENYDEESIRIFDLDDFRFGDKSWRELMEANTMRVSPTEFQPLSIIGTGGSGQVYLVQHIESRRLFAMKVLSKADVIAGNKYERIITERAILTRASQSHFITCLKFAFHTESLEMGQDSHLFFVMEHCSGGNLHEVMVREHERRELGINLSTRNYNAVLEAAAAGLGLSESLDYGNFRTYSKRLLAEFGLNIAHVEFIIAEVIEGISFLHEMGFVYRDLKPQNIMLHVDGHVRIGDFGVSKSGDIVVSSGVVELRSNTFIGTLEYMAPEVISGDPQTSLLDLWGIGILAYELLCGYLPFIANPCDSENRSLFKKILTPEKSLEFPVGFNHRAESFIRGLLTRQCKNRPSLAQLKKHPFLENVSFECLNNSSGFHKLQPRLYINRKLPVIPAKRTRTSSNIFLNSSFSELDLYSSEKKDGCPAVGRCGKSRGKKKLRWWNFFPIAWLPKRKPTLLEECVVEKNKSHNVRRFHSGRTRSNSGGSEHFTENTKCFEDFDWHHPLT